MEDKENEEHLDRTERVVPMVYLAVLVNEDFQVSRVILEHQVDKAPQEEKDHKEEQD